MCSKNPISESKIYKAIFSDNIKKMNELDETIKEYSNFLQENPGLYEDEAFFGYVNQLCTNYRIRDYLDTFICLSNMTCPKRSLVGRIEFTANIVGSVIGEMVFEIDMINPVLNEEETFTLTKVLNYLGAKYPEEFEDWINDKSKGNVWIRDTELWKRIEDSVSAKKSVSIKSVTNQEFSLFHKSKPVPTTREDYVKNQIAKTIGLELNEVKPFIKSGGISRSVLRQVLLGQIFRERILEGIGYQSQFYAYEDNADYLRGASGVRYNFDGETELERRGLEKRWLIKSISTSNSPLKSLQIIHSRLEDIGFDGSGCIALVPVMKSGMALRYEIMVRLKGYEIRPFYPTDLFYMLMLNSDGIERFICEKVML